MKPITFLNIFLLMVLFGCSSKVQPQETTITKAKLVNALAVDGCDWHFTVDLKDDMVSYLPSDSSKEKANSIIQAATAQYGVYSIEVEMKYTLTGKKQTVKCGWGKTAEYDEINISEIKILQ
ncbi:hypothetical protein [Runella slithyformis]|uniref:Lipoprotein n=1 Tax=Runella slithyformis (strain ATCC 29530 / DSM 19594 / LMG 11500 / NCIMB 11436 / LSU 4) TaxID=761193 RepID=A0A7U4E5P9_RUNSL|nr:hypothetical protein [Runella slithyformis]AEI48359.1 hypothetical protein Runsl_1939 [Runella slithyformis DSM 19594]